MKVGFCHPDLGIGGAERLVVDAAIGLQLKGHNVTIFTSFHDPKRAFVETTDGSLKVIVKGNILPREIIGRGHVVFAILKSWILAVWLVGLRIIGQKYDVLIVDQVSASIPILRLTGAKILFYCHFPDKLLTKRESLLKKLYRFPIDFFEEMTTKMADTIVVNSEFTKSIFVQSFLWITTIPRVLYPGIQLSAYDANDKTMHSCTFHIPENQKIILSINRFERKKNLNLAILAFRQLKKRSDFDSLILIIAGGYDSRLSENVEHLNELEELCRILKLTSLIWNESQTVSQPVNVLFIPSFSNEQRSYLLSNALCLIYTPSEEHFGIVPLEAMYSKVPVLAVNSGGPMETVIHGKTGYLADPDPKIFGVFLEKLIDGSGIKIFGEQGHDHVRSKFSLSIFTDQLERIVHETRDVLNFDAWITFYLFATLFVSCPVWIIKILSS